MRRYLSKANMWCLRMGCVFTAVFAFGFSSAEAQPQLDNPGNLSPAINEWASDDQKLEDKIKEGIYYIFIPGILGCSLEDPRGVFIWGENTTSASGLIFNSEPNRYPKILKTFPLNGGPHTDVYKEFPDELSKVAGTNNILYFDYDWRWDISKIAKQFNDKMEIEWSGKLKDKHVIIIAHSMGGVVAWTWKNNHYKKNKPDFIVDKLILLGAPLEGSCEMFRLLLKGYGLPPGVHDDVMDFFYKRFVEPDVRKAALSFPSIFQLLPKEADGCVSFKDENKKIQPRKINYYSIDEWIPNFSKAEQKGDFDIFGNATDGIYHDSGDLAKKYLITRFSDEGRNAYDYKGVWKGIYANTDQRTLGTFRTKLSKILSLAKDFRNSQSDEEGPLTGKIAYFYNDTHETTQRIELHRANTSPLITTKPPMGDGRVLKNSATNSKPDGDNVKKVEKGHGEIFNDPVFLDYVGDIISTKIKDAIACEANLSPDQYKSNNKEWRKNVIKLYELLVAKSETDEQYGYHWALNNLGKMYFDMQEYRNAIYLFDKAVSNFNEAKKAIEKSQKILDKNKEFNNYGSTVYNTMGMAYEQLHDNEKMEEMLSEAKKLGSQKASVSLGRVKKQKPK